MHSMRMLVVTFAEAVHVKSQHSVPSCLSRLRNNTQRQDGAFLLPQKVVGGMGMFCR